MNLHLHRYHIVDFKSLSDRAHNHINLQLESSLSQERCSCQSV